MPLRPPSVLVIGLGSTGVDVALALAESGNCCLCLGDDALASTEWQRSTLCLLQQRSTAAESAAGAGFGAVKVAKRSQFLSRLLQAPFGSKIITTISPIGDASIVERFDVVIMTDPTLPHAIAFNEHARAVGCGFILTEARGAVGRIFEDLHRGEGEANVSRSFREALVNPRISTRSHQFYGDSNHGEEQPMAPTPPMMHSAHPPGASRTLRSWHNSANACESVVAGLVSSSNYVGQHDTHGGGRAAARATPERYAQFHISLQAVHLFWQEHGHLPIILDRDQADEVVRLADELVETGKQVPKGFSSQPESVDTALCHRVASISRVSVPAVSFQLAGLAATVVSHYLREHHSVRLAQGRTLKTNEEERISRKGAVNQWMFVDELDSGLSGTDPAGDAGSTNELHEKRIVVDTPSLEAWLGPDLCESVASARIAVIGCGRLGRDVVRCLLRTGACTEPRGRMVLIDHGDTALKNRGSSRPNGRSHTDGSVIPGRASVLRDLVAGQAGPGGFRVSAFEGGAQDTDAETDLWEGVDAVILCVGRGGAAARGSTGAEQGGCESLVRFVSYKCVLHSKPLVWGWAGGAGEGGAGVEVMAPGRTSCLVCSSHGGVRELIERRSTASTDGSPTTTPSHASVPAAIKGRRDGCLEESWDPEGLSFSVSRCSVAGVMVAELVKVLNPRCRREELRNWSIELDSSSDFLKDCDSSRSNNGSGRADGRGEGERSPNAHITRKGEGTIRSVAAMPDTPRMVLSTSFDPISGDSLRATPEGFTEWGVEEIRPSLFSRTYVPRRGKEGIKDPFSLRTLLTIVFARFGVHAKAVATTAPGSECRAGAGGCREREQGHGNILWAEWEKVAGTNTGQDTERSQSVVSKMDQSVLNLWRKAVSPNSHGEEGRGASRGGKEPRFLYLDVLGVVGGENAILPVLKYWVR